MNRALTTPLLILALIACEKGAESPANAQPPAKDSPSLVMANTKAAAGDDAKKPADAPAAPKAGAEPSAVDAAVAKADVKKGKTLYSRSCVACHGVDGTGAKMRNMFPKIGDLTSPEVQKKLSNDALKKLIMKGQGKMPPLAQMFPEPGSIEAVIAYVRTLNSAKK